MARPSTQSRVAAVLDRYSDPNRRLRRWMELTVIISTLIGAIWTVGTFVIPDRDTDEPVDSVTDGTPPQTSSSTSTPTTSLQPATTAATEPKVLAYEGSIAHESEFAASLGDALLEDAVLELHLLADENNVTAYRDSNTLGASSISFAVDCGDGMPAGVLDRFDLLEVIRYCLVMSLDVVDENGDPEAGWKWLRGSYGLDGFFVVEGTSFGQSGTAGGSATRNTSGDRFAASRSLNRASSQAIDDRH